MKPSFSVGSRRVSVRVVVGALGLAACLLSLSACDSDGAPTDNTAMLPADQRVSSMPWNKQESWEGKGQLGTLTRDPRFTGSQ